MSCRASISIDATATAAYRRRMRAEPRLRLRPPRPDDEAAFAAAHQALADEGFQFGLGYADGMDWATYVRRLDRHRCGIDLPEGIVPSTFLVADVHGELVGRTSIRHRLTEYLAREGGHIGYAVVPEHRRRGTRPRSCGRASSSPAPPVPIACWSRAMTTTSGRPPRSNVVAACSIHWWPGAVTAPSAAGTGSTDAASAVSRDARPSRRHRTRPALHCR